MADLCHEPHPERPGILCDKPKPCWGYHEDSAADITWDGVELPAVRSVANVAAKVAVIVDQASREEKTGPPVPARRSDPETSHAAAAQVQVRAGSYRQRLLKAYVAHGGALTDRQASRIADLPEGGWKRCSELRQGGYIEPTGQTMHDPETGADVMTCVVTDKGRAASV